jgi:cytoskeleton protein RodZ
MSTENEGDLQETEPDNDPGELSGPSGLGAFLKNKRMEKGISINQLAEMTRLRVHFIEALENEDWDRLPAMVFVKGFLRSYANAVEMDAEELLALYRRVTPQREEIPRPLVVPKTKTRKSLYVGIIAIAIIALLFYYFWMDNQKKTGIRDLMKVANTDPIADQTETTQPSASSNQGGTQSLQEPPQWQGDLRLIEDDDSTKDTALTGKDLILKGFVNMRTWVEIYIDDQPPKEYIFDPGDTHEWKAREGFDILVGNAAGIEFDFNGKKINNLGESAKVVRVNLPEGFKSKIREE